MGAVIGPVGTAIGGFVGGTVGYMAGSAVGQAAVKGARAICKPPQILLNHSQVLRLVHLKVLVEPSAILFQAFLVSKNLYFQLEEYSKNKFLYSSTLF